MSHHEIVFTKLKNTPALVRNLLPYLDSKFERRQTYKNNWKLLQKTLRSPSKQPNHNGLDD